MNAIKNEKKKPKRLKCAIIPSSANHSSTQAYIDIKCPEGNRKERQVIDLL